MPRGVKGFQRGRKKTGGRKKGTPNQFTSLKDAFIDAFKDLGAAQGLIRWVRKDNENQKVFYTLVARMLPAEMKGSLSVDGPAPVIQVVSAVPRASTCPHKEPEEMTDEELDAEIKKLKEAVRFEGFADGAPENAPASARRGQKKASTASRGAAASTRKDRRRKTRS